MVNFKTAKSGSFFLGLTLALIVCPVTTSWSEERSASEIAHKLSNSNSSLGSLYNLVLNYRFQHTSNAGIYDDNPGLNLHMLGVEYRS